MTYQRTEYIRTIIIADGYYGATRPLYLCRESSGCIWGVWAGGYITYADPANGIPALEAGGEGNR